ncbi:MAG: glycosyl transferase [Alteromonadaceae bacterium]|nr:MAG: glycosyl transferase [Alteromonadaceae bacterium]
MTASNSNIKYTTSRNTAVTPAAERPLKIALLGYRSHPFVGGQGIYIQYLSHALTALGHQVDVYSGPPYPQLKQSVKLIKVPSLELFEQRNHVTALKLKHLRSYTDTFEWWAMLTGGFAEPYTFGRRVHKLLRNQQYDIIHDNQSLCYALLKLQKKHHVLATIHHPIHRDRQIAIDAAKTRGLKLLTKRWYSFLSMQEKVVDKLKHVITVSQTSRHDIDRYFGRPHEQVQVISNGIDTETFRPLSSINKQPWRLITTASADQPLKGLNYLLEAIHTLKTEYPQICLQVVGKLQSGGNTEKTIQRLQLAEHIEFCHGISTEALVEQYAKASIAISPSLYEGFGLPAGEAMACGLAVIVTDGGALPEVVGKAGITVPKANSLALAQQIRHLFKHPEQQKALGKQARQRVCDNFSWQTVALQLTQHYLNIIDGKT